MTRKKTKVLAVRFTEDDWSVIKRLAKQNGTWAGTWIRSIVLKELLYRGKINHIDSGIRDKAQ